MVVFKTDNRDYSGHAQARQAQFITVNANIYSLFTTRFPADRQAPFLELDGSYLRYADLEEETARYARFLTDLGIVAGDRVAAQVEKSPQALFFYLACLRAGFIYLPLNPAYRQTEIEYFLDDAAPRFILCAPKSLDMIQTAATRRGIAHVYTLDGDGQGSLPQACANTPATHEIFSSASDDTAVILYTSGTTGRPKGAMITHQNLAANGEALRRAWDFQAHDVLLHALPIFHIHGLFVACHCVLLSGSKMIFLPKFDVELILAKLNQATVFMGVPTYYTRLLAEPRFARGICQHMRLFTCGSAPLLTQTFAEFHARTGHEILERYGMTETGMNTSNPLHGPRIAGTVGPPLANVMVRIVANDGRELATGEVGQLLVKGPNVFKGYWRQPEKTAEEFTADDYFKTGDMARQDDRAYVSIVGRAKDVVISGGLNIYPKEIETYIDEIEGVAESAVIGLPHPDLGEAVTAIVVRTANKEINEEKIIQVLKNKIAGFKIPKRVFFVEELPRNILGKVQKNILRERFAVNG